MCMYVLQTTKRNIDVLGLECMLKIKCSFWLKLLFDCNIMIPVVDIIHVKFSCRVIITICRCIG